MNLTTHEIPFFNIYLSIYSILFRR